MQVCLDRFAQGLPDRVGQEAEPTAICIRCGQEIWPGDYYRGYDGESFCGEACIASYIGATVQIA